MVSEKLIHELRLGENPQKIFDLSDEGKKQRETEVNGYCKTILISVKGESVSGNFREMGGLNTSVIKSLSIKLPPIPEQQKIVTILLNIDAEIQKQKRNKSNLEFLKKGLMQKLLTGKIRVKF